MQTNQVKVGDMIVTLGHAPGNRVFEKGAIGEVVAFSEYGGHALVQFKYGEYGKTDGKITTKAGTTVIGGNGCWYVTTDNLRVIPRFEVGDVVEIVDFEENNLYYDRNHFQIGKTYTVTDVPSRYTFHLKIATPEHEDGVSWVTIGQVRKFIEEPTTIEMPWVDLEEADIVGVIASMPNGRHGFGMDWSLKDFGAAVNNRCKEKNS